jgi:NAD(P)-dependent dehydrogenase (short-subunit alcohol dehydrogenase family)
MTHQKGTVAIVTGAASGIGRALCVELGKKGTIVYAADIDTPGAEKTATVASGGTDAYPVHLDVTKEKDVSRLIDRVMRERGRLDYMFNNAGIAILGEVRHMELPHWEKIIDVNLMGVVYGTLCAYRVMREQGFGHIINTASSAGLFPVSVETAYCTTKYGVVGLSTALRPEAKTMGVKVSVVCPGFVRTEIMENVISLGAPRDDYIKRMPPMMDVRKAARKILRGVKRNKSIITIGLDAHILWRLYRLYPPLLNPLGGRLLKTLREIQKPPGA